MMSASRVGAIHYTTAISFREDYSHNFVLRKTAVANIFFNIPNIYYSSIGRDLRAGDFAHTQTHRLTHIHDGFHYVPPFRAGIYGRQLLYNHALLNFMSFFLLVALGVFYGCTVQSGRIGYATTDVMMAPFCFHYITCMLTIFHQYITLYTMRTHHNNDNNNNNIA